MRFLVATKEGGEFFLAKTKHRKEETTIKYLIKTYDEFTVFFESGRIYRHYPNAGVSCWDDLFHIQKENKEYYKMIYKKVKNKIVEL